MIGRRAVLLRGLGCLLTAAGFAGCVDQPVIKPSRSDHQGCAAESWQQARQRAYLPNAGAAELALLEQAVRDCPEHAEAHQRFIELGRALGGEAEQQVRDYYAAWRPPTGSPIGSFVAALLETNSARRLDRLREAVALDGGLAAAHREIGGVWMKGDEPKPENAFEHIDLALRLDRDEPRSNLAMARVLVALGRGTDAPRYYQTYLAARPFDQVVASEYVRVCLYENRDPAPVWELLAALQRQAPGDVDVMMDVAAANWLAGRRDEAADLYRRVLQQRPRDPRAALNLGNLYFVGPDLAEADRRRDWPRARRAYQYYLSLAAQPGETGFDQLDRLSAVPERLRQIDEFLGPAPAGPGPDVSDL